MEVDYHKVGNVQANFCAQLDPDHGYISGPTLFTVDNFRQVGLITRRKGVRNSHIIGSYLNAINEGSTLGFFHDTSAIEVRYMNR